MNYMQLKYIHGLAVSIVSLPLVIASGVCLLAAFALGYAAYAFAVVTTFLYECPLAPKAKTGEDLNNPIAKFSEKTSTFHSRKYEHAHQVHQVKRKRAPFGALAFCRIVG